jgi:hypothetical protein
MPRGEYLLTDPHDGSVVGVERFQCAAGPVGWRYVATRHGPTDEVIARIDLAVDSRWCPARLEVSAGGWSLRGGAVGPEVMWVRRAASGSGEAAEARAEATGFFGDSPAFLVVAAHLAAHAELTAKWIAVALPSLATIELRQRWTPMGSTRHLADELPLEVAAFTVVDLDTGHGGDVHLADDIVVAAPGVELAALEL